MKELKKTEESEVEFVNLSAYLGKGTSLKHKILRKVRKIFWIEFEEGLKLIKDIKIKFLFGACNSIFF